MGEGAFFFFFFIFMPESMQNIRIVILVVFVKQHIFPQDLQLRLHMAVSINGGGLYILNYRSKYFLEKIYIPVLFVCLYNLNHHPFDLLRSQVF